MANIKVPTREAKRRTRRASTPEDRENQMIAAAYDLVEERLLNGTATSQETTHFLRLGSAKERLELEKLRRENELLAARTEALKAAEDTKELYSAAIIAMKRYKGDTEPEDEQNEDLL